MGSFKGVAVFAGVAAFAGVGSFAGVAAFAGVAVFSGVAVFAGVAAFAGVAVFAGVGSFAGVAALAAIRAPLRSPRGDFGTSFFDIGEPIDFTTPRTAPVSFKTSAYRNTMRSASADGNTTSSPSLSSAPSAPTDTPFSITGFVLLMFVSNTCVAIGGKEDGHREWDDVTRDVKGKGVVVRFSGNHDEKGGKEKIPRCGRRHAPTRWSAPR